MISLLMGAYVTQRKRYQEKESESPLLMVRSVTFKGNGIGSFTCIILSDSFTAIIPPPPEFYPIWLKENLKLRDVRCNIVNSQS